MSLNQCNFIGKLGADPEVRYTQSGKMVCSFSIAVDDGYGEKKRTEWVKVVAWEKLAEICANYLHKGNQCFVSGRLQTRSWDDKDGVKRYTTEIVISNMQMLERKEAKPEPEGDCPF